MFRFRLSHGLPALVIAGLAACSDSTAPSAATLTSVTPAPAAAGVPATTGIPSRSANR